MNNTKIYRARKSASGAGVVVLILLFFGLTLPMIIAGGNIETRRLVALCLFWVMGIPLTIAPFAFKLEVGPNYVRSYFMGFRIRDLRASNIETIEYGNLFPAGLGVGKGIRGWEKTAKGGHKYFSIGEAAYGREAIANARDVLQHQLSNSR